MIDTDELRRLRGAATDGPWFNERELIVSKHEDVVDNLGVIGDDNAALIALAPDMADELLWLREQAEAMAEALETAQKYLMHVRGDEAFVASMETTEAALTKYREGRGDG